MQLGLCVRLAGIAVPRLKVIKNYSISPLRTAGQVRKELRSFQKERSSFRIDKYTTSKTVTWAKRGLRSLYSPVMHPFIELVEHQETNPRRYLSPDAQPVSGWSPPQAVQPRLFDSGYSEQFKKLHKTRLICNLAVSHPLHPRDRRTVIPNLSVRWGTLP